MPDTSSYYYDAASSSSNAIYTHPQDPRLHATLRKIDQLANEDVEMQAPLLDNSTFLVLDTNILLHHFDIIRKFVEDVEGQSLPVTVVIPGVVIYELDKQKNRDGLTRLARRASSWLLEKIKERKRVKIQANEETCKASGNWKTSDPGKEFGPERINDALILDCCIYFGQSRATLLCSADKNLCIESERAGIQTVSPTHTWDSEEIIRIVLIGNNSTDDEPMIVDDEASGVDTFQPSHALDVLHLDVIDYLTKPLIRLVGRVGGQEIHSSGEALEGSSASRYAPQWQRQTRHYMEWTVFDILEYLNDKKRVPLTNPTIEAFLSKPHSNQGARRGQDWSRRDWEVVLEGLRRLGEAWDDVDLVKSLGELEPRVQDIFAMKMRPTGI